MREARKGSGDDGTVPSTVAVSTGTVYQRPSTAGSTRSRASGTTKGGPVPVMSTPYRSVSQWTSLLKGSIPSAVGPAAPEPSPVSVSSRRRAEPFFDTIASKPTSGDQKTATMVEAKDHAPADDLSLWLNDEDSGGVGFDDAVEQLEIPPTSNQPKGLSTWRSADPHGTTPRLLRPTSASSRGKSKGKSLPSPRQLNYLDGIVVQMGQPLPRTCVRQPCCADVGWARVLMFTPSRAIVAQLY